MAYIPSLRVLKEGGYEGGGVDGLLRPARRLVRGRRGVDHPPRRPAREGGTNRGAVSIVRNPSYLGLIIASLGWDLAFRSWVGVLLTALTVPPLVARMNAEEALLASGFGHAGVRGVPKGTWRLMPYVY